MTAFVDRLILKNSSDSSSILLTDLATSGPDALNKGELVVGTAAGDEGIYLLNESREVIKLPQYRAVGDFHYYYAELIINGEPGNFDKSYNNYGTVTNTATISSFSKFGEGSWNFNGSSLIQVVSTGYYSRPRDVCTVECWVYFTDLIQSRGLFCHETNASLASLVCEYDLASNKIRLDITTTAGAFTAYSSVSPQINTWHHVAVVLNGTEMVVYLDGQQGPITTFSGNIIDTAHWGLGVSSIFKGAKKNLIGYIDDFRYDSEIARYRAPFNPPKLPVPTYYENQSILINDLDDVNVYGLSSGQVLIYGDGAWFNSFPAPASIAEIPDVTLTNIQKGDVLNYDGANWVNTGVNSDWFIASDGGNFDAGTVASEGNYILNGGLFT